MFALDIAFTAEVSLTQYRTSVTVSLIVQKIVFSLSSYLSWIRVLIVFILRELCSVQISVMFFSYDESHCWRWYRVSDSLWIHCLSQSCSFINFRFFVFFSNSNIRNVLSTHSLCTLISQLIRFKISLLSMQFVFSQFCIFLWSSFFISTVMMTNDALTRSENCVDSEQSIFWCVLTDTSVRALSKKVNWVALHFSYSVLRTVIKIFK